MEYLPLSRSQRQSLWARLGIRLLLFVGALVLLCLVGRPVLSLCMPFLLALLFTWITEPILCFFHSRWKISRGILSFLLILLVVGALGGVVGALVWKVWSEVSQLAGDWDRMWNTFQSAYLQLSHTFDQLLALLPDQIQNLIHDLSDRLLAWLQEAAQRLLPKTTSAARSISSFVMAFLFFLMAWYFTAVDYPAMKQTAAEKTPVSLRGIVFQVKRAFSAAFGGYLKAELLLSLGVMVILLVGFLVIGQPYGVLLAILLGILDFIPILGAGTVMVPWAVASFALGNWERGLPLLVIWGIICLFRRTMEPKFVGSQTGLHPLLSLLAIYVGMKLGGVLWMILAPVLVIMFRNLWRAGVFLESWRDLSLAARDLTAILRSGRGEPKS